MKVLEERKAKLSGRASNDALECSFEPSWTDEQQLFKNFVNFSSLEGVYLTPFQHLSPLQLRWSEVISVAGQ